MGNPIVIIILIKYATKKKVIISNRIQLIRLILRIGYYLLVFEYVLFLYVIILIILTTESFNNMNASYIVRHEKKKEKKRTFHFGSKKIFHSAKALGTNYFKFNVLKRKGIMYCNQIS